jgi:hypothetical protein
MTIIEFKTEIQSSNVVIRSLRIYTDSMCIIPN